MAVIERLRDKTAIALAKGDNSFNLGKARFLEFWLADREIEAQVPKLIEKYNVFCEGPLSLSRIAPPSPDTRQQRLFRCSECNAEQELPLPQLMTDIGELRR